MDIRSQRAKASDTGPQQDRAQGIQGDVDRASGHRGVQVRRVHRARQGGCRLALIQRGGGEAGLTGVIEGSVGVVLAGGLVGDRDLGLRRRGGAAEGIGPGDQLDLVAEQVAMRLQVTDTNHHSFAAPTCAAWSAATGVIRL